jgi:hypothetical protein
LQALGVLLTCPHIHRRGSVGRENRAAAQARSAKDRKINRASKSHTIQPFQSYAYHLTCNASLTQIQTSKSVKSINSIGRDFSDTLF